MAASAPHEQRASAASAPREVVRWRRPFAWRRLVAAAAALAALLIAADLLAGALQSRAIAARRAYKARLDHLAFYALRTGIDTITYQPPERYRIAIRLQNASDEALYVMLPAVQAAVQKGAGWQEAAAVPAPDERAEGGVVRLDDDTTVHWIATLDERDYWQLFRGYQHLRLTLDAMVSPEENPREEVGERHEELFVHVRDRRLEESAVLDAGSALKPDFIPTRGSMLIARPKR
ncbi:MAG: hypothetical protein U1E89_01385 [Burkholderiaceae bacterium]